MLKPVGTSKRSPGSRTQGSPTAARRSRPALPAEAGYDPATVARYRKERGEDPPKDIHDRAWTQWRADRLTEYLAVLRGAVKAVGEDLVFSMAPGAPSWKRSWRGSMPGVRASCCWILISCHRTT